MELLDNQPETRCKVLLGISENMAHILLEKRASLCDLGCEFAECYSKSEIPDLEER